jgi:hypothetical protein
MLISNTHSAPFCFIIIFIYSKAQIFQEATGNLKIQGARVVTWSMFHAEDA